MCTGLEPLKLNRIGSLVAPTSQLYQLNINNDKKKNNQLFRLSKLSINRIIGNTKNIDIKLHVIRKNVLNHKNWFKSVAHIKCSNRYKYVKF